MSASCTGYTLYHYPASQHGRRVVSLLDNAGIDYELRTVVMHEGEHRAPWYLELNPNHKVPTLRDGDLVLHESNAILRYLCNRHALEQWYPSDPRARAQVDVWLDWNQTRLASVTVDIVLNSVFMGEQGDLDAVARGRAALPELLAILEAHLAGQATAGGFLAGASPTIADLSVASNLDHLSLAAVAPDGPASTAWLERVRAIPGFALASAAAPS